jgi:hypothetical protein
VQKLILVRRGTPAAIDQEHDPRTPGVSRRGAQRLQQTGLEIGNPGVRIVEHGHTVGKQAILHGHGAFRARGFAILVLWWPSRLA